MQGSRKWTKEEFDLLRSKYPDCDTEDLAQEMGRTAGAVKKKAGLLGVKKNDKGHKIASEKAKKRSKEAMARIRVEEERREMLCIPRRTRWNLRTMTCEQYKKRGCARKVLRKRDYVMPSSVNTLTSNNIYYAPTTRRSAVLEQRYAERFHFCFFPVSKLKRIESGRAIIEPNKNICYFPL